MNKEKMCVLMKKCGVAVAGAALFSQATSYAMALTGMGLIGIGCAPILMAALYYFGRKSAPERFPFYTSVMVGIGNLGNLLGAAPLAWSVAAMGWRNSMLSIAAMTAVSALLVFLFVDNPPRDPSGVARPVYAGFSVSISVTNAGADLGVPAADAKRIVITVTDPRGATYVFSAYRTDV